MPVIQAAFRHDRGTFEYDRMPLTMRQQLDLLAQGRFAQRGVNGLAFGLPGNGKTSAPFALGHRLRKPDYFDLLLDCPR